MESLIYTIIDNNGIPVTLSLYTESDKSGSLEFCKDALENGEAQYQLIEGCSYEYGITRGYSLEEIPRIVRNTKRNDSWGGRITPGIYVGTLPVKVFDKDNNRVGIFQFEVRSTKASYRDDYRFMLDSITEYCTDLLLQHSSPVVQNFTQDYSADPETLYQRFAFIESIINSEEFNDAVHRIIYDPVTSWSEIEEETDIRRIKRPGGTGLRQIASGRNRIRIPDEHSLKNILEDIPARISLNRKIETADTPENRFIKHALEVFAAFCSLVRSMLTGAEKESLRTYSDALRLEEKLDQILNHSLFRQISKPSTLPLNSPVLQRKEGYREILRAWLMFDLAAKLIWHGGEDIYKAGKRDVAQLYEYWLFFRLLELLKEIFDIEPDSIDSLIEPTKDGLGLKLKSGKSIPLKGIYNHPPRKLNVEFTYNQTFSGGRNYPEGGSWSRSLRPDYTLSLWPFGFTKADAEHQEIIVHIHFDAKYRVESIKDILGDDIIDSEIERVELDREKEDNRSGTYKRADLLKMHAYKDAIRRTGGAYVLYPGNDKAKAMKGFHEIIPGLGAFAIRPSRESDGTEQLKVFILEIVEHFINRASQHERMSFYTYDIHKTYGFEVKEPLPEYLDKVRIKPPADVHVLIGYYQEKQLEWIKKNNLYNIRINGKVTSGMIGAEYLLLYHKDEQTGEFWKIEEGGPELWNQNKMLQNGYIDPSSEEYFIFRLKKPDSVFDGMKWDITKLKDYKKTYEPITVFLTELMCVKV